MLKHRSATISQACSFGTGPKNLTNSICLVGQLILDEISECFSKFVYHADTGSDCLIPENMKVDFHIPELTNSSLHDSFFGQREMQLPHSDNICVVLEVLILNDICLKHQESDKVTAFVVEQWTITYSTNSLTGFQTDHMVSLHREIQQHLASSPLSFWLKEHFQSRRLRLFHRVCSADATTSQLGVLFTTTFDQLFSQTPCVRPELLPVRLDSSHSFDLSAAPVDKHCRSCESKLTSSFTPLPVSPSGFLRLTVVTPERMPTSRPECPLCTLGKTEGDRPDAFLSRQLVDSLNEPPTFTSYQPDSAPRISKKVPTFVDSQSSSELSPEVTYSEVLQSPVVVITNAQRNFFPEHLVSSVCDSSFSPASCCELSNESDTSTLTKKSRSVTTKMTPQFSLESPPRKQQRVTSDNSASHTTMCSNAVELRPTSVGLEHSHTGSIDRVISEFTQLHMEQCGLHSCDSDVYPSSFRPQPENTRLSSPNILDDVCLALNVSTNREHITNVPYVTTPSANNPSPPEPVHGHLPRERRRNATSACIPLLSSSSGLRHGMPFFNRRTGLPLQSSPVPLKRSTSGRFDYDSSLCPLKTSKSSTCMLHDCGPSYALESGLHHPDSSAPSSQSGVSSTCPAVSSQVTSTCVQVRRRPSSLRLNLSATEGTNDRSLRRRKHAPEVDQAEISCSAPPSGNRKSIRSAHHRTRLVNSLACTAASHFSSQHLLVNFEESMLNGRIHPLGQVDGFTLELGASGSFFPSHERIPLKTYFFDLSDDNKPSPYLAYADLSRLRNGKGYHLPLKGSVQLTLFNPNKFVVKMFVIGYDFEDMPPNSQTFLRQRTVYMPIRRNINADAWKSSWYENEVNTTSIEPIDTRTESNELISESLLAPDASWSTLKPSLNDSAPFSSQSVSSCSCSSLSSVSSICSSASVSSNHTVGSITSRIDQQVHLRYLVHLRFHTTRSGRLYLHTDLRLIFARERFEFDPRVATYELRSFIDAPSDPRYSPKKWTKRPRRNAVRLGAPSTTS